MGSTLQASAPRIRPPLLLRLLARLPWSMLYGLAADLAWFARAVLRYRVTVVRANIAGAFPTRAPREQRDIARGYYRRLGELIAEIVKSAALDAGELDRRVTLRGLEAARQELDAGRSVLIVAAHHCNWEWLLLALSSRLGHPLAAAYKPLHGARSERAMLAIRTRFGSRLVPAKDILTHVIGLATPTAVAMVADQEPVSSDHKWWTSFLGRPTAFYMGPELIARAARLAVVFAAMRRTARGRYEITLEPLARAREPLEPGGLTERYARRVEAQILASPEDWTWSHRRWKLRRPMYATAGLEAPSPP
ncbi:MAG: lysophospholipid acyltransferase family protein [Steroidobacteraceae bacterium]